MSWRRAIEVLIKARRRSDTKVSLRRSNAEQGLESRWELIKTPVTR